MKLEFSQHAKSQIKRRGISKKLILESINNFDEKKKSFRGRQIYRKTLKSKTLEVVIIQENDKIIIITVYYL